MIESNLEQMIAAWLEGRISAEQSEALQHRLRESPEARATFRRFTQLDAVIREAADDPGLLRQSKVETLSAPVVSFPAQRAISARWSWAAAAAAVVALVFSISFLRPDAETKIAKITGLGGVVVWTGDGGLVTSDLSIGTKLTGGTIEGVSPTAWVELEFLDGSTVTISGGSRLTFSDFGQKVLHMKEGSVACKVSPQSANQAMLIHTRTAQLDVLGTEFKVDAEVDATILTVTEGKVRLKRLSDGRTVDVAANHRVVATSEPALTAGPIPQSVSQWKSRLALNPNHILGKWFPKTDTHDARLKAVPHVHTTPQGASVTMYTAALQVSGGRESQVILQADSKIRVRGRIALAEGVLAHIEGFVGVTVRHPNGSFGGNFMTSIDPQLITPEQIFGFLDKNGDKKISKAEGLDELKPNFQLIDTNGDGVIDLKEAQVMTKYVNKVHVTAEQVVGFMDKNGDGTISKAEASDELKPHFQGIDTNGDGVIDVKEAQVVAENFNIMVKGSTEHSLKIDREGRFELVFRARNLQLNPMLAHLKADLGETPVGMIVESFWGSTPVASAGLEIVELEIFQPRNK